MEKASTHYYTGGGAPTNRGYTPEQVPPYCSLLVERSLLAARRSRSSSSASGAK